jgi:hypothetical protein
MPAAFVTHINAASRQPRLPANAPSTAPDVAIVIAAVPLPHRTGRILSQPWPSLSRTGRMHQEQNYIQHYLQ